MKAFLTVLVFVGLTATAASAVTLGANAVINGDAETGDTSGWTSNSGVIAVNSLLPSAPYDTHSFTGGTGGSFEVIRQEFDLSAFASVIDAGNMAFDLAADLQARVLGTASDQVYLVLGFRNAVGGYMGGITLSDPTAASGVYDWDHVTASGIVAAGARMAEIDLRFQRNAGASTDSYADNVSLVFTDQSIAPVPVPASLPLLTLALGGLVALRRRRR